MFKCAITRRQSRPGDKLHKVVVEKRDKIYTALVKNEETFQMEVVEVGRGWEIVREINVSESGLAEWNTWSSEKQRAFTETH